jgi:hypothetical protein
VCLSYLYSYPKYFKHYLNFSCPLIAKSLLLIKLDMILDVLGDLGDSLNVTGNYSRVLKKERKICHAMLDVMSYKYS